MNNVIEHDIEIDCGADYQMDLEFRNDNDDLISMTGWTVEAQLRDFAQAAEAIDFTCTANSSGITLTLPHTKTSGIGYIRGNYDVFLTDPDNSCRSKLMQGTAVIVPEVTR